MTKLYFIPLLLIIFSCGNSTEEVGGEMKEFITDSAPATDSISVAPTIADSVKTKMENYFSAEMTEQIENFLADFYAADSDTALEQSYLQAMVLINELPNHFETNQTAHVQEILGASGYDIYPLYEELQYFNGKLGPLVFTCVAECTMLDFCLDVKVLHEKALTTNGKADDDFTDLLLFIYEDHGYAGYLDFCVWDIQYTDYSGSNRLGDGVVLDAVKRLQKYYQTHTLFKDQMDLVHENVYHQFANGHLYEYSLEEVLAEYNKVFKINYYSGKELEEIQKQYQDLKSNSANYQFNCSEGNCTFD